MYFLLGVFPLLISKEHRAENTRTNIFYNLISIVYIDFYVEIAVQ
jgi:hypothetical protein